MRKNVISQIIASGLMLSTLSLSFLPSLAAAAEIEQSVTDTVTLDIVQTTEVLDQDPHTDGSDTVTKREVKEALENIEGLLAESTTAEVTKDADSAAIVTTDSGTTIDLPKDPSDAVVLSASISRQSKLLSLKQMSQRKQKRLTMVLLPIQAATVLQTQSKPQKTEE